MSRTARASAVVESNRSTRSFVERAVQAIGADAAFTDAVLGDLAEERALRARRDGVTAAGLWYARDVLRSTPHLIVNALRCGGPRVRARILAIGALLALAATTVVVAIVSLRHGPPASLSSGYGSVDEGVVINNLGSIRLPVRVTDARGHELPTGAVHFQAIERPELSVSPAGVVRCRRFADATVHASLGSIVTNLALHCRPVEFIRSASWIDFIEGDPPRDVSFGAVSPTGSLVRELRGSMHVANSEVARIVGTTVRPLKVGSTIVEIEVGEQKARSVVTVYQRVSSFAALTSQQRFVALPIRLARGDTETFAAPRGVFWLKYLPRRANDAPPSISVDGRISCSLGDGLHVRRVTDGEQAAYCYAEDAAGTVKVAHGRVGAPIVEGALALDRMNIP